MENKFYGSIWVDSIINNLNGDFVVTKEKIQFFHEKHPIIIPWEDILFFGKKKYPPMPGYHLFIKTKKSTYFILLSNDVELFIALLNEHALVAKNINFVKVHPANWIINFIYPYYMFVGVVLFLISINNSDIQKNLGFVFIAGIYICLLILYSLIVLNQKDKINKMPWKKLLLFLWFAPFIGLYLNIIYFYRYLPLNPNLNRTFILEDKKAQNVNNNFKNRIIFLTLMHSANYIFYVSMSKYIALSAHVTSFDSRYPAILNLISSVPIIISVYYFLKFTKNIQRQDLLKGSWAFLELAVAIGGILPSYLSHNLSFLTVWSVIFLITTLISLIIVSLKERKEL